MTQQDNLNEQYFNWLCKLVLTDRYFKNRSYNKLMAYLNNVDFRFKIPMDGNRFEDGVDLRYRFGYYMSYDSRKIASLLDVRPCSVLEMMVALSIRCEEQIMDNPKEGNRSGRWFYDMLSNLGLLKFDDEHFSDEKCQKIIENFLDRHYKPNGDGGLFIIKSCNKDLRNIEIWYQACWYLDEILEKGV